MSSEELYDIKAVNNLTMTATVDAAAALQDNQGFSYQLAQIIGLQKTMLDMILRQQEKSLENKIKRAMGHLQHKFQELGSALGTGAEKLKVSFQKLFHKMAEIAKSISEKAKPLINKATDKAKEFGKFVKEKIGKLADHVKEFYKENMKPHLDKAAAHVKENFNKAMDKIKPYMEAASENITMAYQGTKQHIGAAIRAAGAKLKEAGANLEESGQEKKLRAHGKQRNRRYGPGRG